MRFKSTLRAIPLVAFMFCPAAEAGWFQATSSVLQAKTEIRNHPTALSQVVVTRRAYSRPSVCVVYNSSLGKPNDGRVVSTVRVLRSEAGAEASQIAVLKFAGGVRSYSYFNCKTGPNLKAGDTILFEHDFKGMPRVRENGAERAFAEVSGVVSGVGPPKIEDAPIGFSLAKGESPLGLNPGGGGGWYHARSTIFQADSDNQKHPKKIVQLMAMPEGATRPLVCSAYSNNSSLKRRGRVLTRIRVLRDGAEVQRLSLAGGVRNNGYLGCKKAGRMLPGDLVEFTAELLNMARLDSAGFFYVHGAVSTAGAPEFRTAPPAGPPPGPEPPTTTPPPPTPPPPGGGGISQADEIAVSKLMINNVRVQLWRSKNNSPAKWQVVGPKTRAVPGTNQLILSTAGVGNTPAQAVADYERKQGSLGAAGSLLSGADRAALVWYSNMNDGGGPTSVRRDGGGGYHGEYFRIGRGAHHQGPFPTFAAAVNWLRAQGL